MGEIFVGYALRDAVENKGTNDKTNAAMLTMRIKQDDQNTECV